jgi:hypothetical protein
VDSGPACGAVDWSVHEEERQETDGDADGDVADRAQRGRTN